MPKTRINRKEVRRLRQKQAFSVATQVKMLAEQLPNQAALNAFLMQQTDVVKRRAMFDFCKPFLKFANPEFPSIIQTSRIILP